MSFKWSENENKFTMFENNVDIFNKDGHFRMDEYLNEITNKMGTNEKEVECSNNGAFSMKHAVKENNLND